MFRHSLLALATSLAVTFAAGAASAGPTIGADLDLGFPLHSRGDSGGGFGIRLGQELHLPLVALTPELGFTYHNFSGHDGPKIYRGIAGLRLGIGEIIRPGAFVHLGIGHFVPVYGANENGFTFDAGGFIDLTLIPFLNFGVHAAYNRVDADYSDAAYAFATVGLHAALVF
jgi:hypothetical protein